MIVTTNKHPLVSPTKKLTVANIFDFPQLMQKIVLVLLYLENTTLQDILNELDFPESEIEGSLRQLVKLGYVGQRGSNGDIIYFCEI